MDYNIDYRQVSQEKNSLAWILEGNDTNKEILVQMPEIEFHQQHQAYKRNQNYVYHQSTNIMNIAFVLI